MATTREKILQTLLEKPGSTIKDLAIAVSINAISVRHHLSSLQADGLVNAEEERHGVGRPRLVYTLTPKGSETFPSNYLQLTNRLLDELKQALPPDKLQQLFGAMAQRQAAALEVERAHLKTTEERLNYLVATLGSDGQAIAWSKLEDGSYRIEVGNCPYVHISRQHPFICAYDAELFRQLLDMDLVKVSSICQGDRVCTYIATPR